MKEDNRAIVRAASLASKASDYLLGHLGEEGSAGTAAVDAQQQEAGTSAVAEPA